MVRVVEVGRGDGALAALFLELWSELDALYGPNPGTEFLPAAMPDDASLFVAYLGAEAVGCAALQPWGDAATFEVKRMFVRATARGTGVAAALLRALEDVAATRGGARLRLETGVHQPRAIAFYVREGFEPCACWGPYADDPLSRCFMKPLVPRARRATVESE